MQEAWVDGQQYLHIERPSDMVVVLGSFDRLTLSSHVSADLADAASYYDCLARTDDADKLSPDQPIAWCSDDDVLVAVYEALRDRLNDLGITARPDPRCVISTRRRIVAMNPDLFPEAQENQYVHV